MTERVFPARQKPPDMSGFLPLSERSKDGYAGMSGWDVDGDVAELPAEPASSASEPTTQDADRSESDVWDAAQMDFANEMAEFIVWEPAFKSLPRFSCCCVPVAYKTSGLQMLRLLGSILDEAQGTVRTITFDNATSHNLLKRFLLGRPHGLTHAQLAEVPFFKKLTFVPFPECALPRWPFQRPFIDNEALFLGQHVMGQKFHDLFTL